MAIRSGIISFCSLCFALSWFSQPLRADPLVVVPWEQSGFWLRHKGEEGPHAHTLYGPSNAAGKWHIAQWHTPGQDMTPFAPVACPAGATNCYLARSPDSEALQLSRDGTVFVRLSSRGDNLPCTGGFQVQELDSFIAPSTNEHYPGYPSAWHPVNLAAISSLHLAATVTPVGYVVPRERPCGHATLAYVLLAAVFNNPSAHQTFFYQLIVGQAESGNILRGSYFYDEKNPFGFDDLLSSYGLYPHGIPEGSATSLRVDLLPKIAALITSGRHGIDPILSHWETSHLYVGHLIFGNLAATTEWSNVSLVAGGLGRP